MSILVKFSPAVAARSDVVPPGGPGPRARSNTSETPIDAQPPAIPEAECHAVADRMEAIRTHRGYVLPSHAVLAATHPGILDAYEAIYAEMTYRCETLSPFAKHFVWLLVVGSLEVPIGGHHVRDFVAAGGTARQVEAAAALAALVVGARALDAVGPGWAAVVPEFDPGRAYERAVAAVASAAAPLPDGVLDLALVAGNACRKSWDRFGSHLARARAAGMGDPAIAEALAIVILPAGNPVFVQACAQWRELVASGRVEASPELRLALGRLDTPPALTRPGCRAGGLSGPTGR